MSNQTSSAYEWYMNEAREAMKRYNELSLFARARGEDYYKYTVNHLQDAARAQQKANASK